MRCRDQAAHQTEVERVIEVTAAATAAGTAGVRAAVGARWIASTGALDEADVRVDGGHDISSLEGGKGARLQFGDSSRWWSPWRRRRMGRVGGGDGG